MSQINEALKHVREGKARYRVVLESRLLNPLSAGRRVCPACSSAGAR